MGSPAGNRDDLVDACALSCRKHRDQLRLLGAFSPGRRRQVWLHRGGCAFGVADAKCRIGERGAVRRMRTRIGFLAQPEPMRSIIGATQREQRHGSA